MSTTAIYQAVRVEGGILPSNFLQRVATLQAGHQANTDYGLTKSLALRDEVSRKFRMAGDLRETKRFAERVMTDVLDFRDLATPQQPVTLGERTFPITHFAHDGRVPVLITPADGDLDRGDARFGQDGRKRSPHNAMQEYLNAEEACLWGLVTNGHRIRLLRDNPSLTRPAYVEADLAAILDAQLYADFGVFWLLFQATRFTPGDLGPQQCILETWRSQAHAEGERALRNLRAGVTQALRELGSGFLEHPDNVQLRDAFDKGEIDGTAYFRELLRTVYRILFLLTSEDRNLLHPPETLDDARELYAAGYAVGRLRNRAGRRIGIDRYADLWQGTRLTFEALARGEPALGLPALGGLFKTDSCPHVDGASIRNDRLLRAMRAIAFFQGETGLTRVNFRDMGTEEFGSVYESLLELHPYVDVSTEPWRFRFMNDDESGQVAGSERKTTGSYYTPPQLVEEIMRSAVDPVIEQTVRANRDDPVSALKNLRIIDPACGSGHFILAAARRVAAEIARLEADADTPDEQVRRHALRDIIGSCIYGVDKNPLAVELCKTALWIEAMEPGKPLTFLDSHIRCGDALVGVLDPDIMAEGIPDAAYKQIADDERDVVSELKKRNKAARKRLEQSRQGQSLLAIEADDGFAAAQAAMREVDAMPEDTVEEIEAKAAAFERARAHQALNIERLRADLFTGAFFSKKTRDNEHRVPNTEDILRLQGGMSIKDAVRVEVQTLASRHQFFHWYAEFPHEMDQGGFNSVVGNPPWERVKLQEQEFFAARSPEIANAQNASKRKQAIQALFQQDATAAQKQLASAFRSAQREADGTSLFVHNSGRFPLTGQGDVNTYALFSELFRTLKGNIGRAGLIAPTGIATDSSTKDFFGAIATGRELVSLFDFENSDPIFPGVHRSFKFCLLTLGSAVDRAVFQFFATRVEHLQVPERRFTLTPEDFERINPNTKTCPVFRSNMDAELTKKIYQRVPVLVDERKGDEGNPWGVRFMRMFDMANDSHLFRTATDLRDAGAEMDGNRWVDTDGTVWLPLYEAKMIHQYDHRWTTYDDEGGSAREVTEVEKADPQFEPMPRYWVPESRVASRLEAKDWSQKWLMGWRDICRTTDKRSVVVSAIPRVAANHKTPLFDTYKNNEWNAILFANLLSLPLDYFARQKIGGTSLTYFFLKQFPIFPPGQYSKKDIDFVTTRVAELTYTSRSMREFAHDLGYFGSPFKFDPVRRHSLKSEIDAYFGYLYGLTRDELRYILDPKDVMGEDYPSETFRVLKNNEMKEYGEYRTQRLVLEAWDRFWAEGTFTDREGIENVLEAAS